MDTIEYTSRYEDPCSNGGKNHLLTISIRYDGSILIIYDDGRRRGMTFPSKVICVVVGAVDVHILLEDGYVYVNHTEFSDDFDRMGCLPAGIVDIISVSRSNLKALVGEDGSLYHIDGRLIHKFDDVVKRCSFSHSGRYSATLIDGTTTSYAAIDRRLRIVPFITEYK